MKQLMFLMTLLALGFGAAAQVREARLQASGLTCSMCSKAVLNALKKVPAVQSVQVDIDKQEYGLVFKQNADVELDALKEAVEEAGFSVARLSVTANVDAQTLSKDQHVQIGGKAFHFLNGAGKQLSKKATFFVVDKAFLPAKEAKKWSGLSSMACVKTGRMEACCTKGGQAAGRVYHVVL